MLELTYKGYVMKKEVEHIICRNNKYVYIHICIINIYTYKKTI